uniref:Uncharacterized protein n=1 Tax=Romanomermis culicivorax TaxID=13658 RepID=A0A915HHK9_ROMCU
MLLGVSWANEKAEEALVCCCSVDCKWVHIVNNSFDSTIFFTMGHAQQVIPRLQRVSVDGALGLMCAGGRPKARAGSVSCRVSFGMSPTTNMDQLEKNQLM